MLNFYLLGLIVVFKGQTTLPWWSYIVALIMGKFITVRLLFFKTQKENHLYSHKMCSLSRPSLLHAWAAQSVQPN